MSTNNSFHSYALGVTGFLGGITFATMVLIMQIHSEIEYSEWLITGTALVSVLFIISTIGMVHVAYNEKKAGENFANFIKNLATLGFFGLMIVLPFLVLPFSTGGAIMLTVIEGIIGYFFVTKRGT